MIQVAFANYVSRRLHSACKICNKPADTQYQVCRECMAQQAKRVENWGRKR